jgi:hypothetical protein
MSNVANKHRGEVRLTLGDNVLLLRPTYSAVAEWEDRTGSGSVQILYRFSAASYRMAEVVAVVAAAARAGGHKVTDDQIGEMLIGHGVIETVPVIAKMMAEVLTGGKEPDPEGEAPAAETPKTESPSAA